MVYCFVIERRPLPDRLAHNISLSRLRSLLIADGVRNCSRAQVNTIAWSGPMDFKEANGKFQLSWGAESLASLLENPSPRLACSRLHNAYKFFIKRKLNQDPRPKIQTNPRLQDLATKSSRLREGNRDTQMRFRDSSQKPLRFRGLIEEYSETHMHNFTSTFASLELYTLDFRPRLIAFDSLLYWNKY